MYYPEELVEEVRARNDIVDVISGYVSLKKKGSNYWGCCPFHNEKTPSFSVSSNKQMYYCFGCHASGNVYTFLMKYENDTFPEAIKILADRAGVKLPEVEETPEQKKKPANVCGCWKSIRKRQNIFIICCGTPVAKWECGI